MFKKVLIANRGAIACRIIRTLKSQGIIAVAIYSQADEFSLHVRQADEAYCLGDGTVAQTYLQTEKILAIAQAAGVEAIHPGYGFLSENADFCAACEAQGIVFVGPTAEQMRLFGLKHSARALAKSLGVPLLPGTDLLPDLAAACLAAEQMGFPVMLKSTAGGGGIGMQVCHSLEQLQLAWHSIKRLSGNNFANDGIYLEKYISQARHIEVQLLGDGMGNVLSLSDRDCSSQRRHQKIIEEAPAPNLPEPVRAAMQQSARELAIAVSYRNAGTVEFIFDPDTAAFYFLEVNTRLQVEHGVTEQIYSIDLVLWMLQVAARDIPPLAVLERHLQPRGCAIQARIYAENPARDFCPATGLLTAVRWPDSTEPGLRIDTWIEAGVAVSPYFDPLLAKVIHWAEDRETARLGLMHALVNTRIQGVTSNLTYLRALLAEPLFVQGCIYTRYLNERVFTPAQLDVLDGGTLTSIQDFPGRLGYWHVGIPPSGPFDSLAFRWGNAMLGNPEEAAGLEITLNGPQLLFGDARQVLIAGASIEAWLDGQPVPMHQVIAVAAGQTLRLGKIQGPGARAYLLVAGGIDCEDYLGAKATFTLGQFGGITGRALVPGDSLPLGPAPASSPVALPALPSLQSHWQIRVIYGPHGASDFFTQAFMEEFFSAHWQVHYNSSRTGIRLLGPKPGWARPSGGEAGMHPSNIHDNPYAIGSIDFTGDMPVILGPDGPSLGGFVCPATVICADLWMLGQLRAGDSLQFIPVALDRAYAIAEQQARWLAGVVLTPAQQQCLQDTQADPWQSPILARFPLEDAPDAPLTDQSLVFRLAGDDNILVEVGPPVLDIRLRFRVHALMLAIQENHWPGLIDITPGIRSLQLHYDSRVWHAQNLCQAVMEINAQIGDGKQAKVPSRRVYLPLSWNDPACQLAVEKYQQSVRKDAPWCPDNIEFIRRINGLEDAQQVQNLVFSSDYLVMGLGDVYLGAPVATPLDPRQRLVTTKYNPARTWTAENSVGIGGAYLCVYGMEGPGGYQFVGRTLQMWNRYKTTREFSQPWLLRFFDQIRFFPVSEAQLQGIRRDFPHGDYPLQIEETQFSLAEYEAFLAANADSIAAFTAQREQAFAEELAHWQASGQLTWDAEAAADMRQEEAPLEDDDLPLVCPVAGNLWQLCVEEGAEVAEGQVLCILESMKMEIAVPAPCAARVRKIRCTPGRMLAPGDTLVLLTPL
jgi:urea carboxylase